MNTTRMPGFAAEASFHRGSPYYRPCVTPAGFRQGAPCRFNPSSMDRICSLRDAYGARKRDERFLPILLITGEAASLANSDFSEQGL